MPMNPARAMLTEVNNRLIAEGQTPIEEQPTLECLKFRADQAGATFDAACKPHYCDGRWGAYRAIECGQDVPQSVMSALDACHDATQAYFLARDGEKGFLGSRGL